MALASLKLSAFTGGMSPNAGAFMRSGDKIADAARLGKYEVGAYNKLRTGAESGLNAHHVGQKVMMKKFVPGYDPYTAPSILVPKVGHTGRLPGKGVVSRSTKNLENARDVVARDIRELRRVYPDIPTSQLKELIQLNKKSYPGAFKKVK